MFDCNEATPNSDRKTIAVLGAGWLAVILVLLAMDADVLVISLASTLIGLALYAILVGKRISRHLTRRSPRSCLTSQGRVCRAVGQWLGFSFGVCVVAFGIVFISVIVPRLYYWVTWNPTGDGLDEGWGYTPGFISDRVTDIQSLSNGINAVATIRCVSGGLLISGEPVTYYVFLRRARNSTGTGMLILRYFATAESCSAPPKLFWTNTQTLQVSALPKTVMQVTRRIESTDGIRIVYLLPRAERPDATMFWQRPLF